MINISDTPDTQDPEAFRLLFPLHLAIRELQQDSSTTSASTNSTHVYTYTAGEDIAVGKLVALSNSALYRASRSKGIPSTGIAVTSGLKGEEVNVLMLGFINLSMQLASSAKYLYKAKDVSI